MQTTILNTTQKPKNSQKMATAAIHTNAPSSYFTQGISNSFFKPFNVTNLDRISTIKKVIELSTNEKSVLESGKLLTAINGIIEKKLPLAYKNIPNAKLNLNNVKKTLSDINTFFASLNSAIGSKYDEIIIDDKNMNSLILNMEKSKEDMIFIMSYLSLIIEVDTFNKAKKTKCSLDEFLLKIDNAA